MTTFRKLPQTRPNASATARRNHGGRSAKVSTSGGGPPLRLRGHAEHQRDGGLELLARRLNRGVGERLLELDEARAELLVELARPGRRALDDPALHDLAKL